MPTAEQVTMVATSGYFLTSVGALTYARRTIREDHRRRRMTVTLEVYQKHAARQQHLKDTIFHRIGAGDRHIARATAIALARVTRPEDDADPADALRGTPAYQYHTKVLIREYLNTWEVLAAGVAHGVYDYAVLGAVARTRLMHCRQDFDEYIRAVQAETASVYEHFCDLAYTLEANARTPLKVADALDDYPSSSSRMSNPTEIGAKKRTWYGRKK
jgi:hypothetical protein